MQPIFVRRLQTAVVFFFLILQAALPGTDQFQARLKAQTHDLPRWDGIHGLRDFDLQLNQFDNTTSMGAPMSLLCPSCSFSTTLNTLQTTQSKNSKDGDTALSIEDLKSAAFEAICAAQAEFTASLRFGTHLAVVKPLTASSLKHPNIANYLNRRVAVTDTLNPYYVAHEGNGDLRQLHEWRQALTYRGLNRLDHVPALSPGLVPVPSLAKTQSPFGPALSPNSALVPFEPALSPNSDLAALSGDSSADQLAVAEPKLPAGTVPATDVVLTAIPKGTEIPIGTLLIVGKSHSVAAQQQTTHQGIPAESEPVPAAGDIGQRVEIADIEDLVARVGYAWRSLFAHAKSWQLLSESEQLAEQLSGHLLSGIKPAIQLGSQTLAIASARSLNAPDHGNTVSINPSVQPDRSAPAIQQPLFVIYEMEGKEFLMPADLVRRWNYVPQATSSEPSEAGQLSSLRQRLEQLTLELQLLARELKEIDRQSDSNQSVQMAGRQDEISVQ